jgi:peptidoglycan/xylan/chitin deacetylase (PgdA/CDA1 family)
MNQKSISSKAAIFSIIVITAFISIFLPSPEYAEAAEGPNLISNPSLESQATSGLPVDWFKGKWGTNDASLTYPIAGSNSSKAARITMTTRTSGDAKWFFKDIQASNGQSYHFANDYRANVTTHMTVRFTLSNGSFFYQDVATLTPTAGQWHRANVNFSTVPNTVSVTVFHLINQPGVLDVDNFSLNLIAPEPSNGNLISNPDFLIAGSNGDPLNWSRGRWGSNTALFAYPVAGTLGANGASVRITNYSSGDAKWYFNDVPVQPNTTYSFSDRYKANITSYLVARWRLSNGSFSYTDIKTLPASATDWQEASASFNAPTGAVSATIFHLIKGNGELTVSKFSMKKEGSTPGRQPIISLSFDDGWLSIYENGLPLLTRYGIKSTQCIVSGYMQGFPAYMSEDNVRSFNSAGHEICAHTRTHADLTTLSAQNLESEVAGSRADLAALGVPAPTIFAYPFGAYNDAVVQAVKDAGFSGARTTNGGSNDQDAINQYLLNRRPVNVDTSFEMVKGWIDQAINEKTWLILALHKVDNSGTTYSTTPETLDRILSYISNSPIEVRKVGDVIAELTP